MNIDGFGVAQKGSRIELVVALLCVVFFLEILITFYLVSTFPVGFGKN